MKEAKLLYGLAKAQGKPYQPEGLFHHRSGGKGVCFFGTQ
jgi:hypothetical protein